MKWLSINKFIPPTGDTMLLRASNPKDHYERYFVGFIDDLPNVKELCHWTLYPAVYLDLDIEKYIVTHFAQIEAVEIEE